MRDIATTVFILCGVSALLSGCKKVPLEDSNAPSKGSHATVGVSAEMVQVPGGQFAMGDKDEPDAELSLRQADVAAYPTISLVRCS